MPGNLCETEVPAQKTLASGHQIKCHLGDEVLEEMEPVIKVAAE